LEDWYSVHPNIINRLFWGTNLLSLYSNSLTKALITNYPDFNWQLWKFRYFDVPWEEKVFIYDLIHNSNIESYIDWLHNELGISHWEDWYHITRSQIKDFYGNFLIKCAGSFTNFVMGLEPGKKIG
jgi:hypothetical protein